MKPSSCISLVLLLAGGAVSLAQSSPAMAPVKVAPQAPAEPSAAGAAKGSEAPEALNPIFNYKDDLMQRFKAPAKQSADGCMCEWTLGQAKSFRYIVYFDEKGMSEFECLVLGDQSPQVNIESADNFIKSIIDKLEVPEGSYKIFKAGDQFFFGNQTQTVPALGRAILFQARDVLIMIEQQPTGPSRVWAAKGQHFRRMDVLKADKLQKKDVEKKAATPGAVTF